MIGVMYASNNEKYRKKMVRGITQMVNNNITITNFIFGIKWIYFV